MDIYIQSYTRLNILRMSIFSPIHTLAVRTLYILSIVMKNESLVQCGPV